MKIVILGAGLSGLAAGQRLSKGHDVTLVERSPYTGGMASSYPVDWDGKRYWISKTYHHILEGDETTERTIEMLGLKEKHRKKKVKQGFIYNGEVRGFSSPGEILSFPIGIRDKARLAKFILLDSKKDTKSLEGMNTREWISSRAGKRNFEVFFERLIWNKFQKPAEDISAAWFATRFFKESSSFMKKLGWLEGGIYQMEDGLVREIIKNGGRIITSAEVISVKNGKRKEVTVRNGKKRMKIQADAVVSTIPPEELLAVIDTLSPEVKKSLAGVRYLSCICLTVGLKKKMTDYYWLNILDSGLPISAVFNHTALYEDSAPKGKSVMFISTYLQKDNPFWKKTDREIMDAYMGYMERIFPGFAENVEWTRLYRHRDAEAIYTTAFVNPPISSDNIYFAGVYRIFPKIRNMASAIESGYEAAEKVENDVRRLDIKG